MSPLYSAIKILLLYLFFSPPQRSSFWGENQLYQHFAYLPPWEHTHTHTHTHIDWVNKIKGRVTWFSLCLFTAVNMHIFGREIANAHTHSHANVLMNKNCLCAVVCACASMIPWIALEPNEGVSRRDSSLLDSSSCLEFFFYIPTYWWCFSHLPTFHILPSLKLLLNTSISSLQYLLDFPFAVSLLHIRSQCVSLPLRLRWVVVG